ncbi:ABC transporter permease [Pseudohalocynthiibacter aestuariivivens]|uniref:ABC transporter permease n=1 Tax=Roseovarius pelagicus TaxID=2980108 RepID=A0ABY6DD80_9RHOB|nr:MULTISPECIES: ABC transporter permease [Rhodobacterales]QIE44076.1 ABC transporter permease [Pseudohalocynthiibacter aestuariivivens]UXX84025.1 ABC transporter permease [Roseovarius pelagicus]
MSDAAQPRTAFRARRIWRVLRDVAARPSGAVGVTLIGFHVLLAAFGPWIVPFDTNAMSSAEMLETPSARHWMGTDHLGRDILSRVMMGGREALFVTGLATPLAMLWGGFTGMALGLAGGRIDEAMMRLVDAFLSLPGILILLVLVMTFGTGNHVLIPTLGFLFGIPVIRVARAATHEVIARDFIAAAHARGHSAMTIIGTELLPNVRDVMMVEGAMRWSWMLLAFSSLSFLGFGVSPPTPDWGLMIADGRIYMSLALWGVLGPVIALSSLIIGINLAADALAKSLGIDRARKAAI